MGFALLNPSYELIQPTRTQCSRSPGNGDTSTDSFELTPPSVADIFVVNRSPP